MPRFLKTGQIGDGREEACAAYVEANARRGDLDDVLITIDKFATEQSMLMNIGDEKGELLDAAVRRADPKVALELGTYCGYGFPAHRQKRTRRQGVLRRIRRGQRRSGPPHLGVCRCR